MAEEHHTPLHQASHKKSGGLNQKYAGLPLWAWGVLGAAALYLLYRRYESSSSSTTDSAVNDGVDPATGIPYSEEEQAYENAAGEANSPGAGGGSTGTADTGSDTTPADEISDITGLIGALEAAGLVQAPGTATPTQPSSTTNNTYETLAGAAASSPAAKATTHAQNTDVIQALKVTSQTKGIIDSARSITKDVTNRAAKQRANSLTHEASTLLMKAAKSSSPSDAKKLTEQARSKAADARKVAATARADEHKKKTVKKAKG